MFGQFASAHGVEAGTFHSVAHICVFASDSCCGFNPAWLLFDWGFAVALFDAQELAMFWVHAVCDGHGASLDSLFHATPVRAGTVG